MPASIVRFPCSAVRPDVFSRTVSFAEGVRRSSADRDSTWSASARYLKDRAHPRHEAGHLRRIESAHHRHGVELGLDPDVVPARTARSCCSAASSGRSRSTSRTWSTAACPDRRAWACSTMSRPPRKLGCDWLSIAASSCRAPKPGTSPTTCDASSRARRGSRCIMEARVCRPTRTEEQLHGDQHLGAGDLPGTVRGRRRAVQLLVGDHAVGRDRWASRACRSHRGTAACSTSRKAAESKTYCDEIAGIAASQRRRDHRARHAPAGSARRRASGLRRGLRRLRAGGGAAASPHERQRWAVQQMLLAAQASRNLGLTSNVTLSRRAGLALPLSLAAAARRPDRDGVRRTGAALAADPRRLRGGRRATSASSCIRARTCSTARPSRCSSSA